MNYNKVLIAGNLTRDPELKFTPKGTAVARFGMAVNRKWKSESGEMKEEATFVDVDCFGRTAETVAQYFHRGSCIFVEGRLKLESWEDKNTHQKRSRLGVVMENFQFVDSKRPTDAAGPAPAPAAKPASAPTAAPEEDPVPF